MAETKTKGRIRGLSGGDDRRGGVGHADNSAAKGVANRSMPAPETDLAFRAHVTDRTLMPVVPATPKRGWMDATNAGFANRCLPMLIANQWGWFILNDRAIRLNWNGGREPRDLQIQYRKRDRQEVVTPDMLLAISHFGHGVLTWRIPYLFQTPPDWNLYVRGPANWCKDGICPLDGVVESDWSSATFTMNWKVTRPNTWIAFEKGEPICMIFPVHRGSLEKFSPEILPLSQNRELEMKHNEWSRSREKFNRSLRRSGAKAPWQKHYVRGMSVLGEIFPEHQTKLTLREFRDVRAIHEEAAPSRPSAELSRVPEGRSGRMEPGPQDVAGDAAHAAAAEETVAEELQEERAEIRRGTSRHEEAQEPEARGVDYSVVVSSENSPYMAWQTQLFCFSSISRLRKYPTVVVHRSEPLLPEFGIVASWGCRVVEAPQFRNHPKQEYPARNELGSLLTISEIPDFCQGHVLFCETDMLFASPLAYSGELAGQYYSYLDYRQPRLEAVARKFGLTDPLEHLNETSRIGVPYLIPGPILPRIARRWIEVLDAFEEIDWIDIMYAFGLALAIENLPIKATHHMTDNENSLRPVRGGLIHYCYGDALWNKRAYWKSGSPLQSPTMPIPTQLSDTVLGEILRQIREARACSQYPRLFNNPRFLATIFPR